MSLPIEQMLADVSCLERYTSHSGRSYAELALSLCCHVKALAAEVERLQGELDTLDRKVRHGCADANCGECDHA